MISKKYLKILIIVLITNLLIFVLNSPVSSQNPNSICSETDPGCVLLDGQPLFKITEKAGRLTAEERAKKISETLKSKANDMSINIDSFSATPVDKSTAAVIQNSPKKESIMTILQKDADAAKAKSPLDLASKYKDTIQTEINNYRVKIYRKSIKGNSFWTALLGTICFLILMAPEIWFYSTIKWIDFSNRDNSPQTPPNNNPIQKKTWETIQKEYRIGRILPHGEKIEFIYYTSPEFVIYRSQNRIRTYINEDHIPDLINQPLTQRYIAIKQTMAKITSNQPETLEDTKPINGLVATGILLALYNELTKAEEVLKLAEERLKRFNTNYNRFQYLRGSFHTTIRFMFFVLSLKILPILFPDMFNNLFDLLNISEEFYVVIFFGAIGGFLSVAYGITRSKIDLDFGSNIKILAASRIYIAVISSLIIYSALKGNFVDGISSLIKGDTEGIPVFRIAFISTVAGFVERLIPNLLTKSSQNP